MGSGGILILYLIFGSFIATIATVLLRLWIETAEDPRAKPRCAVFTATIFPWACLAWAFWILGLSTTIDARNHRDPGYGDVFYCRIPNGYEIEMIDLLEYAWLRNPNWPEDGTAMQGIVELQVAGVYFAGGADPDYQPPEHGTSKRWFLIDTAAKNKKLFESEAALAKATTAAGFQLKLEPIERVYRTYRWTDDGKPLAYLFYIPPQVAFGMLLWWLYGLRTTYRRRDA